MLSRRRFIQSSALAAVPFGLSMPLFAQSAGRQTLQIPPLMEGSRREGVVNYDLTVQSGQSNFLPGLSTDTIGFNGNFLGPTLRLKNGDDVSINIDNQLDEDTTVHWHGLHLPAAADGGPHQVIEPGRRWQAQFQVIQRAGPFWYHSHRIDRTGEQVYRGMAGMLLVEDEESQSHELPSDYGVDDIPLIIQDREFNEDGSFSYINSHQDIMFGKHGDTILVNGTIDPVFVPRTRKVRFRLMNASNARTYTLAFSDGRQFQQLGCDGGFLAQPLNMTELTLASAERCEIVVDFSDGAPVNLISKPLPANSPYRMRGMMGRMHGALSDQAFHILAIEPQSNLQTSAAIPPILTEVPDYETVGIDRQRRFELGMVMGMGMRGGRNNGQQFSINGQSMHMVNINERVPLGSTEVWEIHNGTMMMHPFHIHHGQFQVKSRNGRPPYAHERAFKDTVKVAPGETVQVVMEFLHYADPEHAYMYHCHILEHEDNGMMGQFVVE
jgi:FtsP/CotA-like multicopper oxidase with cupredoxin domain